MLLAQIMRKAPSAIRQSTHASNASPATHKKSENPSN